MCCPVLRMLEAVEDELCLLEVLDVPEVMRCVLHTLYARGCGGFSSISFGGSKFPLWQFARCRSATKRKKVES